MKKIPNYLAALYLSGVVGVANAGYFGYHCIKDEDITKKTATVSGIGFGLYTLLWGAGAIGLIQEERANKKELEEVFKEDLKK